MKKARTAIETSQNCNRKLFLILTNFFAHKFFIDILCIIKGGMIMTIVCIKAPKLIGKFLSLFVKKSK